MSFCEALSASRVLPVVTPVGIDSTLRTEAALDSIAAVKQYFPKLAVAAG